MKTRWFENGRLGVAVGDITKQHVDAVVFLKANRLY